MLLHSAETGELMAVMNGSAITAIRTAAVSGLATNLLARDDAKEVAIIGTGVQGRMHLQAMAAIGGFERARVCSRRRENAEAFAKELGPKMPFTIEPVDDVKSAVESADVINTTTNAREPVLHRDWVKPGTHINAVGSSIPTTREVDTATMTASTLFVDRREATLNESGDYLFAAKEGASARITSVPSLARFSSASRSAEVLPRRSRSSNPSASPSKTSPPRSSSTSAR